MGAADAAREDCEPNDVGYSAFRFKGASYTAQQLNLDLALALLLPPYSGWDALLEGEVVPLWARRRSEPQSQPQP